MPDTKIQFVTVMADCCFSNSLKAAQTTAHVIKVPMAALPAKLVSISELPAPDTNLPRALPAPNRSANSIRVAAELISGFIE